MSPVRPPNSRGPARPDAQSLLEQEIRQEQAATLGRIAHDLQAALDRLAAFDDIHPDRAALTAEARAERAELVGHAGRMLWYLVIQREACGLHRNDQLFRDYRVPAEVRNRMGAQPRPRE